MVSAEPREVALDEDPAGDPGVSEEYPTALAARIGSRFDVPAPLEAFDFPQKGNIHQDTYLLVCGPGKQTREYLLQRLNQQVFTRPKTVMRAMLASLEAQRASLAAGKLQAERQWEVITLVPTRGGAPYLECVSRRGTTVWRLMVKIPDCRTYKSLAEIPERDGQLALAEETGRGLAMYGDFTAGMDVSSLENPLPGYRDTRVYFDQFASILAGHRRLEEAAALLPPNPRVLASTQNHFLVHLPQEEYRRRMEDPDLERFIALARGEAEYGLTLARALAAGRVRTVAIHGDTKLENFLFCARTGQVKSLVDLDTIMPHTWLSDWGDMVRSLANVAGEKERDLRKVRVDLEIYAALARGFLSTAREVTREEVALMAEAVELIALELGVRFLTDYLRGDSYFRLTLADPPDLNKVRALVQLTLFENLRQYGSAARRSIEAAMPRR
jgi:hypothetical protein